MRIFHDFKDLPEDFRNGAAAIGNFDGVHLGHQAVIGEAGRIAKAAGVPWLVVTLEPHPRRLFRPDDPPFRLTPFAAKARRIAALGVDGLVVLGFDSAFSQQSAEHFVRAILVEGMAAHHVVSGYDFVFGHRRQGDGALLLKMGRELGFGFTSIRPVSDGGGAVLSASRARKNLTEGDPAGAAAILGAPFEIEGVVLSGDARGRTLGFPTANLALGEHIRPAKGVYAVRVAVPEGDGESWHAGVANLGNRPTFDKTDLLLEAHLFDFAGDLYGKTLRVAFIDYLRPEKKFDGIDGLKAQIAQDSDQARRILAAA